MLEKERRMERKAAKLADEKAVEAVASGELEAGAPVEEKNAAPDPAPEKNAAPDDGDDEADEVEVHGLADALRMIPRAVIKAAVKAGARRDVMGGLWLTRDQYGACGKLLMKSAKKIEEAAKKSREPKLDVGDEWARVVQLPPNDRVAMVEMTKLDPGRMPGRVAATLKKRGVHVGDEAVLRRRNGVWELV
jgi:hypothetical protein